jgi:hypothetical protein
MHYTLQTHVNSEGWSQFTPSALRIEASLNDYFLLPLILSRLTKTTFSI